MVIVQNGDPFTFFGARPIRICEGAGLDKGSLSLAVLKRATLLELPTVVPRVFSRRAATVQRHRQIDGFPGVREARVTSVDGAPFPLASTGTISASATRCATGSRLAGSRSSRSPPSVRNLAHPAVVGRAGGGRTLRASHTTVSMVPSRPSGRECSRRPCRA